MKKLIFMLALFIGSVTVKAQEPIKAETVNLYDSLKNDAINLAKFAVGPAKQVFDMTKQKIITGAYMDMFIMFTICMFFLVGALVCNKLHKARYEDDWDIGVTLCTIAASVCLMLTFAIIGCGIHTILNADYYTLKELVETIRG